MFRNRFHKLWTDRMLWLCTAVALAVMTAVFFGCNSDNTGSSPVTGIDMAAGWGPGIEISGECVSFSECVDFFAPVTETWVDWVYDGNGTLDLSHIAAGIAGFPMICSVSVYDKTIHVIEQSSGPSPYMCLIIADYQITGLPPGKYLLKFDEAVDIGDDEPLECEILLKGTGSSGKCTAERTYWPWGGQPVGQLDSCLLGGTGCPFPNKACVAWDYDGVGTLSLIHNNEYTSCCFVNEPAVYFLFSGDVITIIEDIEMGALALMVNVETNMHISHLPPGQYHVILDRFMELETVEFTLDLSSASSGTIGFD